MAACMGTIRATPFHSRQCTSSAPPRLVSAAAFRERPEMTTRVEHRVVDVVILGGSSVAYAAACSLTKAGRKVPPQLVAISASKKSWQVPPQLVAISASKKSWQRSVRRGWSLGVFLGLVVGSPQDKPTTAGEPILLPFEKKVAKAEALQVAAAKAKAADDHTTKAGRTLITTVRDSKGTSVDIYDEPIPKDCYAEDHGDYDGNGIQWGLTNKGISAADCCRQCKEFRAPNLPAGVQGYCNVWTWACMDL
eukprot:gene5577-4212_t